MAPHADLAPRIIYTYDDGSVPFWYTETGYIVRWVLFSVFVLIVLLWVVGGYFHARHRIKKGLRPMGYHSCFAPRRARYSQAGWYGSQQQQQQYGHNAYNMNNMPPPPMYDSTRPPEYYAGPPDGTKVDPSQWRSEPTRRPAESSGAAAAATTTPGDNHIYEAPPGPPPAVVR